MSSPWNYLLSAKWIGRSWMSYCSICGAFPGIAGVNCLKQRNPIQCIQSTSQCWGAAKHWISQLTDLNIVSISSCAPLSRKSHEQDIFLSCAFFLQQSGVNKMWILTQPCMHSSSGWCPWDRCLRSSSGFYFWCQQRPFALGTSLENLSKQGLWSAFNVHLIKAVMHWNSSCWFQLVWIRHWNFNTSTEIKETNTGRKKPQGYISSAYLMKSLIWDDIKMKLYCILLYFYLPGQHCCLHFLVL